MKILKKASAVIMVVLTVLLSAPLNGFLDLDWSWLDFSVEAEEVVKTTKKLEPTGQCGESVFWNYNSSTGDLFISGSGTTYDYYYYTDGSPFSNTDVKNVVVDEGVTYIGSKLFWCCKELEKATISGTVDTIGSYAFTACFNLETVVLSEGLKKIHMETFGECYKLSEIVFPESLTTIGYGAFAGCYRIKRITIPKGVTELDYCFQGNTIIYCYENSAAHAYAVEGGHNILLIDGNEEYLVNGELGDLSWFLDMKTGEFKIEGTGIIDAVDPTAYNAKAPWYAYRDYISSIEIGEGITGVGYCAFSECRNVVEVKIPTTLKTIDARSFSFCLNLENFLNNSSIISIGDGAFAGCYSFINVTIPDTVIAIGDEAFLGCENLTEITIGANVSSLGDDVFYYCQHLKRIEVDDKNKHFTNDEFGVLFNKEKALICYPAASEITTYNVPVGTTKIEKNAFAYAWKLINVTIPDSVERIESDAFYNAFELSGISMPSVATSIGDDAFCGTAYIENSDNWEDSALYIGKHLIDVKSTVEIFNIKSDTLSIADFAFEGCKKLVEVTIPNGITRIPDSCFQDCEKLESVDIPSSVEILGYDSFLFCDSLESVHVKDITTWLNVEVENRYANPLYNEADLYFGDEIVTDLVIPRGVTFIGFHFENCTSLESVTIPCTVETIYSDAFNGCCNIERFVVDKNNANYSSDECGVLFDSGTIIQYPIGRKTEEYIIPTTVKKGDENDAYYSVTHVWYNAFADNVYLKKLIIPDTIKHIPGDAFGNNKILSFSVDRDNENYSSDSKGVLFNKDRSILVQYTNGDGQSEYIIPGRVDVIDENAFNGNDKIESVFIPKSVKKISGCAFENCDSLKNVYYEGSAEQWSEIYIGLYNDPILNSNIYFNAYEGKIEYEVIWIADEEEIICTYEENDFISIPEGPAKEGYVFVGWTPDVPDKMPDEDLIFTAQYIEANSYEACVYLEHTTEYYDLKYPTCYEKGYGPGVYCFDCDKMWGRQEIPAFNHEYNEIYERQDATCTEIGYTEGVWCLVCEDWISGHEVIPMAEHSYDIATTHATLTENGKVEKICSACGDIELIKVIPHPETIKLSSASVTYNGKVRTPSVSVTDSAGNTLTKDVDYTVEYEDGRKNPGKYVITVTFIGDYEGEKKLDFTILPKAPAASDISATQSTSVIKLSWKASEGATGYRVYQYSPSKGKYVQIASIKTTTYKKSTSLKAGTEYKFKIKPYTKLSDGTVLWGTASAEFATATECKAPVITSVTATKTKATVKWSDVDGETGYQLYYSTKKDSGYKKVNSYTADKLAGSKTFSASASGKTIYFKVRAYKKVNGQTIFSEWSAVKSVKLK